MIPEQVSLLFYEDKQGHETTVFGNDMALKAVQRRMMKNPRREFCHMVELDQSIYDKIWKLINTNEFQQGWDLFVEECAEQGVYLCVETRTVDYGSPEFMATATGRVSSRHPNISNGPQADVPTEYTSKYRGDEAIEPPRVGKVE